MAATEEVGFVLNQFMLKFLFRTLKYPDAKPFHFLQKMASSQLKTTTGGTILNNSLKKIKSLLISSCLQTGKTNKKKCAQLKQINKNDPYPIHGMMGTNES